MLTIDGTLGEGGGQVLRSTLALARITGPRVRSHSIRAGRGKPGLAAQHLTGVRATARVGSGRIKGAELRLRDVVRVEQDSPSTWGVEVRGGR